MAKVNSSSPNPFLRRYSPNVRFTNGGFSKQPTIKETLTYYGDSITDKERVRGRRINFCHNKLL